MSGRYGKGYQTKKIQEALESMFAEACWPGHSPEDAESKRIRMAEELCALVKEMAEVHAVAVEWERAGSQRTYEVSVRVDSEGIRKGKCKEWQLTSEEAAPQPHTKGFRFAYAK